MIKKTFSPGTFSYATVKKKTPSPQLNNFCVLLLDGTTSESLSGKKA